MAASIPPMLKYSTDHSFLNSPPVLIKFVSKFLELKSFTLKHNMLKVTFPFKQESQKYSDSYVHTVCS